MVLSHLAVWPGVYVVGAVVYFIHLTDAALTPAERARCLALAFCVGVGAYLLNRVKLRDAWLDPADAAACRARFDYIRRHAAAVRAAAFALLTLGLVLAWSGRHEPWMISIPFIAAVGVVAYAGRPRRRSSRVKDVLILKNMYVAAGIGGFAAMVVWIGPAEPPALDAGSLPIWIFALATLWVRVIADAILCDLDDQAADQQFGTRTVPTTFGHARAWNTAMIIRLVIAAALAAAPVGSIRARLVWAILIAGSSIALRLAAPRAVRDWVDARFGVEALAASIVLHLT